MNWRLGFSLFVCACGSVSEKPDAAVADARPIDGGVDAPPPPCDLSKPFATPVQVAGINTTASEQWGWLTEDRLTIYFARAQVSNNDYDLFVATRSQPSGAFGTPAKLTGNVNTTNAEQRPFLSSDGLTMFLESNATGGTDVHVATRASTAADFSAHAAVGVINDGNAADLNPMITSDSLTMYFASNRAGTFDIYKTTRTSTTAPFVAPVAVGELNTTTSDDYAPVLSKDGLEMFFSTTRGDVGHNDIWRATRSSTSDGFGTATASTELNVGGTDDVPGWLSADRCQLVFMSNRTGTGAFDIWIATRPM